MGNKLKIMKDDRVAVISGKDKGRTGKVLAVFPKENKIIVERVNFSRFHTKRRGYNQQGGIIERESPIDVSNVMLICPRCNQKSRTSKKLLETGFRVRICGKCHEVAERK